MWRATARHATRSRAAWQIHAMRYDQIIDVVSTHEKERPDEFILKLKLEPQETEVSCNVSECTCTKPRPRTARTSTASTAPSAFGTQPHMAERTRTRTAHHLDPVLRSHACMRLPCVLMLYTAEWRGPLGILLRECFATSEYLR